MKLWNVYDDVFVDMVICAETKEQALDLATQRLRELDSDHPALRRADGLHCDEITTDGGPGIVVEKH